MRFIRSAVALALLPLSAALAHATEAVAKGGDLWVNGVRVAHFVAPVGAMSASNRAELAASRLSAASSASAKGPYVFVDGEAVYAVAVGDAKAAGVSLEALAAAWARSLSAALKIKPLEIEDGYVTLPVGGLRGLRLKGIEAAKATFKSDNASVATASRTIRGVLVRGNGVGRATISIQGATGFETVEVTVKPVASSLPKTLETEVTGAPAVGSTVSGAIQGALNTRLTGLPGVKWKIASFRSRSVESGSTLEVPVRVTAEAPGAYPATGLVTVRVRNVPLPRIQDESLWYSNDPETVRRPGRTLRGERQAG